MQLVAGIDTLGAIAGIEVDVELQSADAFHHGQALFLGDAWIDGALIDHHIALADDLTDGFGSTPQGTQVGAVVGIHRGGHGHHIEVALLDFLQVGGAAEAMVLDGILQQFVADFEGSIMACHEGIHAALVHVEADGFELR